MSKIAGCAKAFLLLLAMLIAPQIQVCAQELHFESNKPLGEGKGIFPGRVTWVRDSLVTLWNGHDGHWWDEGNIDQKRLEKMYDQSLCALSGERSVKKAWKRVFQYYNAQHDRGNRGYGKGEQIVIKINLNNTYTTGDRDNDIDQSPQATIAILRQLTANAGIPQECITVYDASIGWRKRAIPDRIYQPVHRLFPQVKWMSATGSAGVDSARWVKDAISYTDPNVTLGTVLPKAEELGFSGAPQFKKGSSQNCDNYLKEAAKGWNATLGDYRPNGVKTGSLGVFEHWNNARDKQYGRNLGRNEGIELIKVK